MWQVKIRIWNLKNTENLISRILIEDTYFFQTSKDVFI